MEQIHIFGRLHRAARNVRSLAVARQYTTAAAASVSSASQPSGGRVRVEKKDGVAVVTLNRADKLNALDMPMFEAIVNAARELKIDRTVRCVVLQGEGRAFSSGLDFASVATDPRNIAKLLKRDDAGTQAANLAQAVGYAWRALPVPVIACIRGVCFGGGLQIALGADFRYSTPDAQFSIMEAKWGLIPDMSASVTLRELVRCDVAKELSMTGRVFGAAEAKEMGLLTRVCDDPVQEALAFAREISSKSPDSVAATKALFNNTRACTEREALLLETELQKKILPSWNQLAAVAATLRKTKPRYIRRKRVWDKYLNE